jgi:hypothetical protein
MTDDLAEQERRLAHAEVLLDQQEREARRIGREAEELRRDALRRLDFEGVKTATREMDQAKQNLETVKELRAALGTQHQQLAAAKAEQAEAAWVAQHGPRPCSYLSIADRLTRLGLDGHLVASIVPVVESHQHSVAWAEDPDRFMPGASAAELERAALALSKLISLIHGRDDEAERALAQAREYARDEAHRRRPNHPWRDHQRSVGFP